MIIVLSVVFALFPLLGIGWIAENSSFTTVDGLFTTLILLTLSGILFLNAFLGIRKRLQPKNTNEDKARQAQKAS
jgi:hypothetical protein